MCDCYYQKCENCNNQVSLHVADYCTGRENIKVLCHECVGNGDILTLPKGWYLIEDTISRENQVVDIHYGSDEGVGIVGEKVYIYCSDKDAYGVELN